MEYRIKIIPNSKPRIEVSRVGSRVSIHPKGTLYAFPLDTFRDVQMQLLESPNTLSDIYIGNQAISDILANATGGGVTAAHHDLLLPDAYDDHLQYHNDTRGDARYYTRSLVDSQLASRVIKAGTPVNNQLAIWTDVNSIEGDSKVTFDGTTLRVTGNIIASGEVSSFQGTAPTSWWDSMPVATATSRGGIMYDPDFFFVNTGGQLEILPNVISAAAHNHDERYFTETELTNALALKANSASPTFTGTVSGITASMVGLGNVNNTSDANKPVSTAQQTALNLKANLASPTFTGTVAGITATMVGLGNVNNTSDANKPVSIATQTALNLKANLASPTFTGTVSGITASMVGLGNVTNESKATMFTNPTFTGNLNVIGRIKASYADLGIETYIDTISGNAYIDSLKDDAGYNMNIRMRSSGTPVTNATFFGNGDTTLYGNVSIGSNPNEREFALTKDEAGDVVMQIQNTNVAGTTSRSVLLTGMENDGASIGFYAHGTNHSGTAYGETLAKAAVLSFGANTDKAIIAVGKATVPLMFATNGDVRMTLGTSGNLTVQGDVIAYG